MGLRVLPGVAYGGARPRGFVTDETEFRQSVARRAGRATGNRPPTIRRYFYANQDTMNNDSDHHKGRYPDNKDHREQFRQERDFDGSQL